MLFYFGTKPFQLFLAGNNPTGIILKNENEFASAAVCAILQPAAN